MENRFVIYCLENNSYIDFSSDVDKINYTKNIELALFFDLKMNIFGFIGASNLNIHFQVIKVFQLD